ncbi:MAG: hypothetical protein K6E51_11675 [Treponema sp.]|nr:hypothetical protein [Treponema sp.]
MNVNVYSRNQEDGILITKQLLDLEIIPVVSHSAIELFNDIQFNKKVPDLFIIDYYLYNHDYINFALILKKRNLTIPILFYNDPFVIGRTQIIQEWEIYNNFIYGYQINLEKYHKIFEKLSTIVPYFAKKTDCPCLIFNIQTKYKIQKATIPVLDIFLKNRTTYLSVKDILNILQEQNILMQKSTAHAHVSRLKKIFNESSSNAVKMDRINEKYKLLINEELLYVESRHANA